MSPVMSARKEASSLASKIWHGAALLAAGALTAGVLAQSHTPTPLAYAGASAALTELVTTGLAATVLAFVLMGSIAFLCARSRQ